MRLNSPTIIFTSFWDAKVISENGGIIINDEVLTFLKEEVKIFSIAIAQPNGFAYETLDFLCPSWDILKSYKLNRDWETHNKSYKAILVKNKMRIAEWVDSLSSKVYILCCWENTCNGANCHRRIVYKALKSSKRTKDLATYIYRHGDKNQYNKEKQIVNFYFSNK